MLSWLLCLLLGHAIDEAEIPLRFLGEEGWIVVRRSCRRCPLERTYIGQHTHTAPVPASPSSRR